MARDCGHRLGGQRAVLEDEDEAVRVTFRLGLHHAAEDGCVQGAARGGHGIL
jgi:hypothetical protein